MLEPILCALFGCSISVLPLALFFHKEYKEWEEAQKLKEQAERAKEEEEKRKAIIDFLREDSLKQVQRTPPAQLEPVVDSLEWQRVNYSN